MKMKTTEYVVEEQRHNANYTEFTWEETFRSVKQTLGSTAEAQATEKTVRWYAPTENSVGFEPPMVWKRKRQVVVLVGVRDMTGRPYRILEVSAA